MYASLLSFDRRGLRLSSLVLGAALLAACDNDRPLGPDRTNIPAAAALGKGPTKGIVSITLVDNKNNPLASAGAEFSLTIAGQPSVTAIDNGIGDSDPTVGTVFVKGLTPGVYDVCEKAAPAHYVLPTPNCATATVTAGVITPLAFINPTMARLQWGVIDFVPNNIGGAEFELQDGNGNMIAKFVDNAPIDVDPNPGRFALEFPVEGQYMLCPINAPAGYVWVSTPMCIGFTATHGQVESMGDYIVYPEYSAYWYVTDGTVGSDGFPTPLGPSTFQVTNPLGFITTIVDNGPNDFDPRIGKFGIKLPAEATYTVCQTVAPVGYQPAIPQCKRIEVRKGIPGWGEWFYNPPK